MLDLEKVVENSPLSIYVLNQNGYFSLVNQQFVRLSGYSKEELLQTHFSQLVHDQDLPYVLEQVNKRLQGQEANISYEFRALKKSGQVIYTSGHFTLVEFQGQRAIMGQLLDISDKKHMEYELRKSEEKYRTILDCSNVGYFEVDLQGNFIFFNEAIAAGLGYSREELQGLNNQAYTNRENAKKVFKAFNKVYRTGQPERFFDWEVMHKDGSKRIVETSVDLIIDEQGIRKGFRGIVQDVTERKLAEARLKASEDKYRTIFEGSGTAMIIIREDTVISMANKKFLQLSGYSKEEVEGQLSWTRFVHENDLQRMLVYHYERRKNSESAPNNYEFCFLDRQCNERHILANVNLMPNNESVASFLDLTERKKIEEELKHLSLHDTMTGLYNRRYFEEYLNRLKQDRLSSVAIVVLDIDGLKLVNDQYGHKAGDELICTAAEVVRKALREKDVVARIGGDEFGILLPGSDVQEVNKVLDRIRQRILEHNKQMPEHDLQISMGFAVGRDSSTDLEELFRIADGNMYADKLQRAQELQQNQKHPTNKVYKIRHDPYSGRSA